MTYQMKCTVISLRAVCFKFVSPAVPKARDGRYCNAPHPSVCVCPSVCPVTINFRTVTRKHIDVFSLQVRAPCHGGVLCSF